ncbi:MAG TPA: peroxidase [Actinomycetota bacterium]|nr:peroxidase [Actinomycetota bacterium]
MNGTTGGALDLADVQGTILRGYRVDYGRHFVLEITDPAGGRSFLGSLVDGTAGMPQITTAAPWASKPATMLNVGITYQGLLALGIPPNGSTGSSFPQSFVLGATNEQTAKKVGDVGSSAPKGWVGGLANGDQVHLILSLWAADSKKDLENVTTVLQQAFQAAGISQLGALDGNALPDNKVHFGYTDNISQPIVEGAPPTKRPRPDGNQPVAPTGEFLLGYPSQNPGQTYSISPSELSTNSSFGAFRYLLQDVAAFEQFLHSESVALGMDPELLAAKICGRWRNGIPLILSPDKPDTDPPLPIADINNYNYVSPDPAGGDPCGFVCPIGSHMRRTNPRDMQVVGGGNNLHRIVRRNLPFGPPWDPRKPDDTPRGLVGYFLNADLSNQFEFLQGQWVNQSTFVASASCPGYPGSNPVSNISGNDPILGQNNPATTFTLPYPPSRTSNVVVKGVPEFVTTKGGAYCLLPSITGLKYLAALDPSG